MVRHHRYSKRSRESRKAMTEGVGDPLDFPDADDSTAESWQTGTEEPVRPPGPSD